jgi:hypothetical protein
MTYMSKPCSRCGESKSGVEFYKKTSTPDGLSSACRVCSKAMEKASKKRRAAATPPMTHKVCSGCKVCHPASEFHKNAACPGGLAAYCKPCMVEVCVRLRATRRAATTRNHKSDPVRLAAWRKKYYDAHRAARVENANRWQRENPGLANAKVRLRQVNKLRATPSWADLEFIELLYVETSDLSRREVRGVFHIDHVVPLKSNRVCGLHTEENLRAIPAKANMSKSNRFWPDMF